MCSARHTEAVSLELAVSWTAGGKQGVMLHREGWRQKHSGLRAISPTPIQEMWQVASSEPAQDPLLAASAPSSTQPVTLHGPYLEGCCCTWSCRAPGDPPAPAPTPVPPQTQNGSVNKQVHIRDRCPKKLHVATARFPVFPLSYPSPAHLPHHLEWPICCRHLPA